MEQLLELDGIIKLYDRRVINGVNLSVGNDEVISIAGGKASGKTTLMKLICGIERLDDGRILLCAKEISSMNSKSVAKLRNKYIGVVSSDLPLQENMTILDNVALPLTLQGASQALREQRAKELLYKVGLGDVVHAKPKALKLYELKCAQLARGFCHQPSLVISDDFFCEVSREEILKLQAHFKSLLCESSGAIILSQDNCPLADKFYTLKDGKLEDVQ